MHSIQLRVDCCELHHWTNQELHSKCNLPPSTPLAYASADLWWCMSRLIKHASRVQRFTQFTRTCPWRQNKRKHMDKHKKKTHTQKQIRKQNNMQKKKKTKKLNKHESSSWQKQSKVSNTPQKVTKSSHSVCARFESNQQHVTVHGLQAATINLCSCVPLRI